jgi:hypothetical protein
MGIPGFSGLTRFSEPCIWNLMELGNNAKKTRLISPRSRKNREKPPFSAIGALRDRKIPPESARIQPKVVKNFIFNAAAAKI